ncbi:hypothetical protein GCM10010211_32350 [Streptomyces albospinus]|uniref:Uncharacterized protein n=1 Tax=Streptomyces albospinus TaxID=285515 RepID=A0ABQ2V4D1_9ACTN|nr:hypothetical protein GCM10010211_32350 [Streptomyces albospinus]
MAGRRILAGVVAEDRGLQAAGAEIVQEGAGGVLAACGHFARCGEQLPYGEQEMAEEWGSYRADAYAGGCRGGTRGAIGVDEELVDSRKDGAGAGQYQLTERRR